MMNLDELQSATLAQVTPRWIELRRDGKIAWLDLVDGKFAFGGDMEPTEAAKVFLDAVGMLIEDRIKAAASTLSQ